ncbi:MAG: peptidase [Rhodospirillaceae bacterium]|nr:peptidase [Rhodospirillaceae bacterium]
MYATPLLEAAGLTPDVVNIILVNDDTLNAFVAGGQNLFINTGLIMRTETPNQLIGVIAHEIGHIAGGHLARSGEATAAANTQALLSMLLGLGAAIAGGGDVGSAVMMGGQQTALRSLLAYTRTQERSADQAALKLLDETGQSSKGMLDFLDILSGQELLYASNQDPYLRTHPLSSERIDSIAQHVKVSPYTDAKPNAVYVERHARMVAKLMGFLRPPNQTFLRYPDEDQSLPARYARAIATYRIPDIDAALKDIDALIAERPQDPFFQELKGQMLFENGRLDEALEPYRMANELKPNDPLLLTSLAQVLVESGKESQLESAVGQLKDATRLDPRNALSWRLLAISYGRLDQLDESALASAEEALLTGRMGDAHLQAERASRKFPEGSPGWLRAQDIIRTSERKS